MTVWTMFGGVDGAERLTFANKRGHGKDVEVYNIDRRPPTADRRPPTADRRPPTADRRPL